MVLNNNNPPPLFFSFFFFFAANWGKSQKHSTDDLKRKNRGDVGKVKIISRAGSVDDSGRYSEIIVH